MSEPRYSIVGLAMHATGLLLSAVLQAIVVFNAFSMMSITDMSPGIAFHNFNILSAGICWLSIVAALRRGPRELRGPAACLAILPTFILFVYAVPCADAIFHGRVSLRDVLELFR